MVIKPQVNIIHVFYIHSDMLFITIYMHDRYIKEINSVASAFTIIIFDGIYTCLGPTHKVA